DRVPKLLVPNDGDHGPVHVMGVAHRRHHRGGCDFYWPFCGTEPVRPGWSKYEGYRELGQPPYQGLSQKVRRATHQALPASPISSRQENQKSRCASGVATEMSPMRW